MQELHEWLLRYFPYLFAFCFFWSLIALLVQGYRYRRHGPTFPDRDTVTILFEESWASGRSAHAFGMANNCLRVTLTNEELWIEGQWPMAYFTWMFGFDRRLPLADIHKAEASGSAAQVHFSKEDGTETQIALYLGKVEPFLAALEEAQEDIKKAAEPDEDPAA